MRSLDDEAYQHTPEVRSLKALLSDSKIIPKWLTDLESPAYYPFKCGAYRPVVAQFTKMIPANDFRMSEDNPTLDMEVAQCLSLILGTCITACHFDSESTDAKKRCYINVLLMTLWNIQTPLKMFYGFVCLFTLQTYTAQFSHSQERHLRVPQSSSSTATIPDSSVFLTLEPGHLMGYPDRVIEGCCIMHTHSTTASANVLHWVTEYNQEFGLDESRRQVRKGLAAALCQRRALGFMDHFVFGTCHFNQVWLEVVAATWVSIEDEADSVGTSRKVDNALPSTTTGQHSDMNLALDDAPGLHQCEGARDQSKAQDDGAKLVSDLNQRNKIAVYSLGTYSMRDLALKYRDAIITDSATRIRTVIKTNLKLFDWYNPPPKSDAQAGSKSGSSEKQTDLLASDEPGPDDIFYSHNDGHCASPDALNSDYDSSESDNASESILPSNSNIDETTWEESSK
ncbi:hypothetical protein V565_240380 [Rhizoctonia solani 123E]|uniref:Uncharacterized protein n=1 Tax=Rhizoctonia solani 123E TaxID=1423351 RepID=A0A074RGC2_9AGAM|nr:hypothetical protein V565_240380 [Rhizoctonia solani 123E]